VLFFPTCSSPQYKQLIYLPAAKLYEAEQRELRRGKADAIKSPFMGNMHK
jgi:hypothetical protein